MTQQSGNNVAPRRRARAWLNGLYATAEYISLPLGLLVTAPYLLRHMGTAQFGIWVLASTAVNSGNIASSGFGDAAIKYVAMYRGRNDTSGVAKVIQGMLSINLALGGFFAAALWSLAPYASGHIAHIDGALRVAAIHSFRIGSLLLVVRCIDGVLVSTLRAFEHYAPAVRITMCSRIAALIAAVVLVACGRGVVDIMLATLEIAAFAAVAQGIAVRAFVGRIVLLPSLHRDTLSKIMGYGCFSWLQAISAAVFGQADRLVIGVILGAPAVAGYALCAQAAQTIHGVVAAGFHALFPHLSSRLETERILELRHTIWNAFKANFLLAFLLGSPVTLFSRPILSVWIGREFALQEWPILSILALGFALFGLNVTAHYALLAFGKVRIVTFINLAAGAAMLLLMLLLTPKFGMIGTACSRLICGPITCLLYYPLYKLLHARTARSLEYPVVSVWENS
jgi:O-antigen/teichoic acid export membrane protein